MQLSSLPRVSSSPKLAKCIASQTVVQPELDVFPRLRALSCDPCSPHSLPMLIDYQSSVLFWISSNNSALFLFRCLYLNHNVPHKCLVPPNTSPATLLHVILPSISSSTRPTTATLSPRMMYSPSGTSSEDKSSSVGRMIRSTASWRTRFMDWSQERRMPTMVRPSWVRTETFS